MVGQERFGYFAPGRAAFSKVTRRKSGTISRRYRSNGYAHKARSKDRSLVSLDSSYDSSYDSSNDSSYGSSKHQMQ